MISLFIALCGIGFLFLWQRFPTDESGQLIPAKQRQQQLVAAGLLLFLALLDFIWAPQGGFSLFAIRVVAAILLLFFAGKASRQVAVTIYYLTAVLILIRGLLEIVGR